jgi:hypothetical protein
MVSETEKGGKRFFQCEECNFLYAEKGLAERCEAWCKKHHSCNIEITRQAIKI